MIWSLFGAIAGWIQGAIGQFRSTSGYLEHTSDGSTWYPVSPLLVKASNNVKHTFLDRTIPANTSIVLANLLPYFTGTIRVTVTISTTQANVPNLTIMQATGIANNTAQNGSYGISLLTTHPAGTVVPSAGNAIFVAGIASGTISRTVDAKVTAGESFCIIGTGFAGNTVTVTGLTFAYDTITTTEVL